LFIIAIVRGFFDEKYGMCSYWKRPGEMLLGLFLTIAFLFSGISSLGYIQNALNSHNYEIAITISCGIVVLLSLLSALVSAIVFIITPFVPSHHLM
jgi:hypothetical protein